MKARVKSLAKGAIRKLLPVLAPLSSKKSALDEESARQLLSEYSAKPMGEPLRENLLTDSGYDLQIIIPAYNVESYLEECLESILSQKTKYTYKVVLIDDGSTDSTPAIADRYADDERILVIHQKNAGFSGARNTGLKDIFAKYIMFVDSDDALCPGAIDALLDAAFAQDYDIVEGGAYTVAGDKQKVFFSHPQNRTLTTAVGTFHGQPWAKVFKAHCFASVVFPEGYWFEDSILSFLIYPQKNRVGVVENMVYRYRLNPAGITATAKGRKKTVDTYWITEMLTEVRGKLGLVNDAVFLEKLLRQFILNQQRMAALPEEIKESAFVLSAAMIERYFPSRLIASQQHPLLLRSLLQRDWGIYQIYCRFH